MFDTAEKIGERIGTWYTENKANREELEHRREHRRKIEAKIEAMLYQELETVVNLEEFPPGKIERIILLKDLVVMFKEPKETVVNVNCYHN